MKRRNLLVVMGILLIIFISALFGYFIFNSKNNIKISNIELTSFDKDNNMINVTAKIIGIVSDKYKCYATDGKMEYTSKISDGKCLFSLPVRDYEIYIKSADFTSEKILLSNKIDQVLDFKFSSDILYLAIYEKVNINYNSSTLLETNFSFVSSDDKVVKVDGDTIMGLSKGEAYISESKQNQKFKVIVTNLITKPYATKEKKELLPCKAFTSEEAKLLDEILESKINNAGYQTRAGALAAARFLTLEFKYRVPYYYETGRIKYENKSCNIGNINTYIVDGEGRYYHKGLYLSEDKVQMITSSKEGPAMWGCKIRNLEKKPEYGYVSGAMMPNGLDCSGFVTWSLKNAGFEPGDVGAGEDPGRDCQCTDLGEFVALDNALLKSGKIKSGDLINWWGHIAMIIGIDEANDKYYIAESLSYINGVRAMIYTKKELLDTFKYVVLMDDFYKEDGNYTKMWE